MRVRFRVWMSWSVSDESGVHRVRSEAMSPEAFVGHVRAGLSALAGRSWEGWTLLGVTLSEKGTELLIMVEHPRVRRGTLIEYPVEYPLEGEQVAFCLMWVEPLLDSANDPMAKASGSPLRIAFTGD